MDYVEQAFIQACVRESIQHGPENELYACSVSMPGARPP
jgi:hypothetical protein